MQNLKKKKGEITRFNTYGFDLKQIAKDAEENGNVDFAKKIKEGIAIVQACYDACGERYTSCPDDPVWKIDAEYIDEKVKAAVGNEKVEE